MDLVLVDLVLSHQVVSVNSNQDLRKTLGDNHLDKEHNQVDLEHNQADLEEEQAASELNLKLLVLVNHKIQETSGELLALKHNLNRHQHLVMSEASHRILNHNNLVYLEVVSEEEQVALDNKVDLHSNRIHLDSEVLLVRNHLNLN